MFIIDQVKIGNVLHISINEILAGEILTDEQLRKKADENIVEISRKSVFSLEEKRKFWISKWRKEHIGLFITLFVCNVIFVIGAILADKAWMIGFLGIIVLAEYGW